MSNRYGISESSYLAALSAFHAAIARAPGQVAFANICRCTQGNISLLVSRGSLLPARYLSKVETAFGIDRAHLRPDLYPTSSADLPGDVATGAAAVAPNRTEFSVERKRA